MPKKLKTSAFNLSYSNALSFNIGELIPVYLEDCVPGDHFVITPDFYVKFAPLVFPVLQRIEAKIKYFFVPNRIMWKRWEKFITGGKNGTDVISPPFTTYADVASFGEGTKTAFSPGQLGDYMGYPDPPSGGQATDDGFAVNLLPFYAYQLIWNEYFRDETLAVDFRDYAAQQYSIDVEDVDAETYTTFNATALAQLFSKRQVAWKKDYFTTASPWAQRGAEVHIPSNLRVEQGYLVDGDNTSHSGSFDETDIFANNFRYIDPITSQAVGANAVLTNKGTDTEALGTLNDFYKASALQRFLQKSINGSRYIEQILNFFGVRVPDFRLQRPEYIGGVSKTVQISEVLQTSQSTIGEDASALGSYAGKAAVGGVGKPLHYKVKEHGWIIGLLYVRPDASYFQGIRKNLFRTDRFDYFWPQFQGIGEQPVYKKELFAGKNNGDANEQVWAYQSRFSEYKFHNNEIHGDFRDSMDAWTMARKFISTPGLNAYFTYVDSDATGNNRIFAVPSADSTLYGIVNNNVTAFRPMLPYDPYHSV